MRASVHNSMGKSAAIAPETSSLPNFFLSVAHKAPRHSNGRCRQVCGSCVKAQFQVKTVCSLQNELQLPRHVGVHHSALGYTSPAAYHTAWIPQQKWAA